MPAPRMAPLRGAVVTGLLGLLLTTALLAPGTVSAQSRTLGSPLAVAPNATFGCEAKPTFTEQSSNGDYFVLPSGQPDCTWFQSGVIGSVDYSDPRTGSVPAGGRITNVAVRSGPNPAPLRVTIVRQIGGVVGNNLHTAGCCAFVSETPPLGTPAFQPQPNTTTNFPVDIPVERNVRGTSAVADYVGISARAGTGTLPLFSTGRNNTLRDYTPGSTDAGFIYPRLGALEGPGGGTRNNESIPGVELLVQWTWTPSGVAPGPPQGGPAGGPGPATRDAPASAQAARVAAGRATVALVCGGEAACAGRLELISTAAGARTAARKQTVYGKANYTLAPGAKQRVQVKLNRRGRRLLKTRRRAKVTLRVIPTGGTAVARALTLRR